MLDDVGAAVKEMRLGMGWSIDQLAIKAEVSHGTVINIEKGRDTRLGMLMRIARALNVKPCMLLMNAADRVVFGKHFNIRW